MACLDVVGRALSAAVGNVTAITARDDGSTPLDRLNSVRCSASIQGADLGGRYKQCMDKMASQWGRWAEAEVGNWREGIGCRCQYGSPYWGGYREARRRIWDAVLKKNRSCSDVQYRKMEIGMGVTQLNFSCRDTR